MNPRFYTNMVCKYCGKEFLVGNYEYRDCLRNNTPRKFCSLECYRLYPKSERFMLVMSKPKISKNCYYCKKLILILPSLIDKKKREGSKHLFCSRECYRRFAKITENNPQFGKHSNKGRIYEKSKDAIYKTVKTRFEKDNYKSKNKGKKFEEIYGIEKAKELKNKLSLKQKMAWKDESLRKRVSEKRKILIKEGKVKCFKSENNPAKTEEFKKMIKEVRKNLVLPMKDTSIEVKIQNFLKQLGITFFTHQYIKQIEHGYQCDILIPHMNLVIECDGDYWHKYPIGNDIDHIRTKELLEKGFRVLRLWEHEIRMMHIEELVILLKKSGFKELPEEVKFLMNSNLKK